MMSCFMEESKKKILEEEYSEFLIQKIKHAGGSIPFHHLSGLLQQAKFEIRDMFGTTKSQLMKFLRAHSKIFHIDPLSVVTVSLSPFSVNDSCDDDDDEDNYGTEREKTVVKKIENGIGKVIKLHPEFGIIKTVEPLETEVYFKSDAFIGNNDLLTDSCLEIGYEVYFNAVSGHGDFDIKFRATKVWLKFVSDANYNDTSENQKAVSDNLESEESQATIVKKKSEEKVQSIPHSKIKAPAWNRIENEPGKIYPHINGAVIKFRNSEAADGNSSSYFLYGTEVSDIAWEFSEGDDVWFDAIEMKSAPGWKAVLVWVGEKPDYVDSKIYSNADMLEISDRSSTSSKNNSTMSLKCKPSKSESVSPITQQVQCKSRMFDHVVSKNIFQPDFECKKQNSKSHGNPKSSSAKKLSRKRGIKPLKEIQSINKCTQNGTVSEREVVQKPNHKNSTINRLLDSRSQSITEMDAISGHSDESYDDISFKGDGSDTSERSYLDDEFQDNSKNLLKESYGEEFSMASQHTFINYKEKEIGKRNNEIEQCKSSLKGRPSIKMFEGLDGEILNIYCKAGIVKSSQLQRNIDFVLNDFYIDGKSVEEQQVIDLKEIIKVGDHVNFNCFEIIDDFGEMHQKVTAAWKVKDPKPCVREITPQEFINEYELSVTISDKLVSEYLPDERKATQKSPGDMHNFDETVTKYDQTDLASCFSKDMSDIKMLHQQKSADTEKQNSEVKDLSLHAHKLLSQMIIHRLKSKGIISSDLQVDFSSMLTEIISLAQKHENTACCKNCTVKKEVGAQCKEFPQADCSACSEKKISVFSDKNKKKTHAAAQTIITGAIVAQKDDFTEKVKFNEIFKRRSF